MSSQEDFLQFLINDLNDYIETIGPVGERVIQNQSVWTEFLLTLQEEKWKLMALRDSLNDYGLGDRPEDFESARPKDRKLKRKPPPDVSSSKQMGPVNGDDKERSL